MSPEIYIALVRHAEYRQLPDTPSAMQPFPLTDRGLLQIDQAVQAIAAFRSQNSCQIMTHIDSSNLLRAWQTASGIAAGLQQQGALQPKVHGFDTLSERCVGSVANLSVTEIAAIIDEDPRYDPLPPGWKSDSDFRLPFPGAESLLQAGARVAEHISSRIASISDKAEGAILKVFVGHGAAFRHAAYHMGVLQFQQLAELSMHYCRPVFLHYRGDSHWCHVAGEWKIRNRQQDYTD